MLEEVGKCYRMMIIKIRERPQWLGNSVPFPTTESYMDLLMYMLVMATNNERLYKPQCSRMEPVLKAAAYTYCDTDPYAESDFWSSKTQLVQRTINFGP